MSWSPADDYDDDGNYAPGPYPPYTRFTRCAEHCCTGTPLCRYPEGDTDDQHDHYRAIQDFAPFTIIHGGK